jgi:hypothetical protein
VNPTVVQDQPFVFVTVKAIAVQEGNLDSEVATSRVFYVQDATLDTGEGRLWAWGHNMRGQLGLGDGLYAGDKRFPNEIPVRSCTRPRTRPCGPDRGGCDGGRGGLACPICTG